MEKIIDLALKSGKAFQSSQTGFIHYHYQTPIDQPQQAIPVYENFLFALTLFRTRIGDHIQEAKQLIKQLLPFQNHLTTPGNFPIYLHQYPSCLDPYLPITLLLPLYWILKDYSSVLGADLQKNLQDGAMQALRYSIRYFEEKENLPDWLRIKIASTTQAFSALFKLNLWQHFGNSPKESMEIETAPQTWYIPELLGEILPALQIVDPQLASSNYTLLKNFLQKTWFSSLATYVGPSYREYFEGHRPQLTPFHLWMYQITHSFPALTPHPRHLTGALIQTIPNWEPHETFPSVYEQDEWKLYRTPQIAVTTFPKKMGITPPFQKALHPLKITWEHEGTPASFVCYGHQSQIDTHLTPPTIDLTYTYPKELPETRKMKDAYEVQFYFSALPNLLPLVNGVQATLFTLDDTLTIPSPKVTLKLTFHPLTQGTHCVGHLMRTNRPSQKKENTPFNAYDWGIYLRTIERNPICHLRISITWIETSNEA